MDIMPELGDLLLECKKHPRKKWAIKACGDWGILITTFLVVPIFGTMAVSLGIFKLIVLMGVNKQSVVGMPFMRLNLIVFGGVVVLLVWWMKRCIAQYDSQLLEAYEKGVRVGGIRKVVYRDYLEIDQVFFGTKSRLSEVGLAVASIAKSGAGRAASDAMSARLTIKFKDGTCIRVIHCRTIFKRSDLQQWRAYLSAARPDLFERNRVPSKNK